jgi:hypothetical protein
MFAAHIGSNRRVPPGTPLGAVGAALFDISWFCAILSTGLG